MATPPESCSRLLKSRGHEVQTAGDVATALDLAGRSHFDLLISDLGLPDGSGHDLMRQLRATRAALPGHRPQRLRHGGGHGQQPRRRFR